MSKKRTPEEQAIHDEAVRLRKMTDIQLVTAFRNAGGSPEPDTRLETLLEDLDAGKIKGVKGATAYKIGNYAKERGLIT